MWRARAPTQSRSSFRTREYHWKPALLDALTPLIALPLFSLPHSDTVANRTSREYRQATGAGVPELRQELRHESRRPDTSRRGV